MVMDTNKCKVETGADDRELSQKVVEYGLKRDMLNDRELLLEDEVRALME